MLKQLALLLILSGCQTEYGLELEDVGDLDVPVEDSETEVDAALPISNVDVFVVIDTSGSMSDNDTAMSQAIVALKRALEAGANQWTIVFITADPATPAYFRFTTGASDIDMLLAPGMLPSAGGEKPFGAMWNFHRLHPNFFVQGHNLVVFIVTDEDDQTTGITVPEFDMWLTGIKTGGDRSDVISIAGLDTSCGQAAPRLLELAQLRGSAFFDICQPLSEGDLVGASPLIGGN